MIELLRTAFEANREKTAFISGTESLTFGEIWERASVIAGSLAGSDFPVIVRGHKEGFVLCAFVACIMASRAYIPFDDSLPEARLKKILGICRAEVISEKTFVPCGKKPVKFRNCDEDTAYIIFTSGSSGEPKGVPITRGNLKAFLKMLLGRSELDACRGKTVLNQARFSFDLSVADIYFSLCTGSALFALTAREQEDPALLADSLVKSRASLAVMTPTFAKYCLLLPEFCREAMPELRCIFFCGEMLEAKTVKKLFHRFDGLRVLNAYGPTEATCAVCASEITQEMLSSSPLPCGDIGQASCHVEVVDGEIVLSGDSVFHGYLGREKPGGSYFTGDRGEIRGSTLFCLGRKYGYIKYKGHRIEPDEIKAALLGINGVTQAGVSTAKKEDGTVTAINAFVTAEEGMTGQEIRERLRELLPEYMLPKTVTVQNTVTFNGNGKQDF